MMGGMVKVYENFLMEYGCWKIGKIEEKKYV